MERAEIYAFIRRHRYGVVSSTASDGSPQSALVGIAVTAELEIVFDTLKSTRKHRNLLQRPACSFVVGSGEQTLQFEGIAEEPRGAELRRLQEAYFAAWPDGIARMSWPGIALMVVHPQWIRYSDYDRTPPFTYEVALPG